MNKLKGELCAFCMIFSAIITYSECSYNYKEALLEHTRSIAVDIAAFQRQIHFGKYPLLVRDDKVKTGENINNFLSRLGYSEEEIVQLKCDTFGAEDTESVYEFLATGAGGAMHSVVLESALTGNIEIPYWMRLDDPGACFPDISGGAPNINESGTEKGFKKLENHLGKTLYKTSTTLGSIVDFAHKFRKYGYTPTEFLKLYSDPCGDLNATDSDPGYERCKMCPVAEAAKEKLTQKLQSVTVRDDNNNLFDFSSFVNLLRSIENKYTYAYMRAACLGGEAGTKTPSATNPDTAGEEDLFNFLHLFLQKAYGLTGVPEPGKEENIAQVVHLWLTKNISDRKVDVTYYPKVISTLVDMMYIAHVKIPKSAVDATINHDTAHILSKTAIKEFSEALENIDVNGNTYRLVGINDLRIDDEAYKVLGLKKSFISDNTSFLLPVAVLQDKNTSTFSTYNGAPLLIASDIVYMARKKKLPTVSMIMVDNYPISTYRTGHNLMKQSVFIKDVTHDGSYNGVGISEKYGAITNNTYAKDDWSLTADSTLEIDNKYVNLIVAELFSWYTHILDANDIAGVFETDPYNRTEYEDEFQKKTKNIPTAHAFIVHNSRPVKNIGYETVPIPYTPNTVYEGNDKYINNHYISMDPSSGTARVESNREITGTPLISSLLNSSWGGTMLREDKAEPGKFQNITSSKNILKIGKASDFNKSGNRANNISSTVHKLNEFYATIQIISNYTFPGFQLRGSAYGKPFVRFIESGQKTCTFIQENKDGIGTENIELQDSEALNLAAQILPIGVIRI